MTIRTSTTEYRMSHGKEPRGFGYWAIRTPDGIEHFFNGTLTSAKLNAAEKFKAAHGRKPARVVVLP